MLDELGRNRSSRLRTFCVAMYFMQNVCGTWRGRGTIFFVSLLFALLLFFGYEYRSFYVVFWTTASFLALLQWIALSRWKRKAGFFKYSDYIYYLAIALVVGVGSRYVDQRSIIEKYNAKIEVARLRDEDMPSARAQISAIDDAEQDALEQLRLTNSRLEGPYLDPFNECVPLPLARKLFEEETRDREKDSLRNPCLAINATILSSFNLPLKIAKLRQERELAVQKLNDLNERYNIADKKANEKPSPDHLSDEMVFIFIPTVLIVGTTMKLGKTTATLFP